MRIPKFLIRFSHTRLWRYKWRILACAPFILAIIIYASYMIFNHLAMRDYLTFVQSWETKGESVDSDLLLPPPPSQEQDFFHHPTVVAERNDTTTPPMGRPNETLIPGFSHDSFSYRNSQRSGNYKMGVAADITYWLASSPKPKSPRGKRIGRRRNTSPPPATPRPPTLTEKETAVKCLEFLKVYDSRLQHIAEATTRPHAYIPLSVNGDLFDIGRVQYAQVKRNIASTIQLRAKLRILAGDVHGSDEDMRTLSRLYQHSKTSPALISFFIGKSTLGTYEEPLWLGLKNHLWDDPTLAQMDQGLAPIDLRKNFLQNLRQEVCHTTTWVDKVIEDPQFIERTTEEQSGHFSLTNSSSWKNLWNTLKIKTIPSGLYIQQATWALEAYDDIVFYPNGKQCETITIEQAEMAEATQPPFLYAEVASATSTYCPDTHYWLARQIRRTLQSQANLHNMRTAIALERYRIKHQTYPESLTQLVPDYLPRVLEDVITDKPLNYRIKDDGTPLIYSIGANQIDDGGKPHRNPDRGDWAWMYSPPKGFTYDDYKQSY